MERKDEDAGRGSRLPSRAATPVLAPLGTWPGDHSSSAAAASVSGTSEDRDIVRRQGSRERVVGAGLDATHEPEDVEPVTGIRGSGTESAVADAAELSRKRDPLWEFKKQVIYQSRHAVGAQIAVKGCGCSRP